MKRDIYGDLLEWKNDANRKPFMLLGARQVGKTYIIEEFCKKEFKEFQTINLFRRGDIVELYKKKINSDDKYLNLKAMLDIDIENSDNILFIDEIQESEELISELKYFCEEHNNVNIICAGSLLGVKLDRLTSSFPVGKVWMKTMYPMNFHEFLIACNQKPLIDIIENSYEKDSPLVDVMHERALSFYRKYLVCGGMPESVKELINCEFDITKYNANIIDNIILSYFKDMKKHVKSPAETIKIEDIYRSLAKQLTNQSKKFQYSKVNKDARSRDYETALKWILSANIALQSFQVTTPEVGLNAFINEDNFKIFVNDIAILARLANIDSKDVFLDNIGIFKGPFTENFVACELVSMGYSLYYWKNSGTSEVDFMLYKDGLIIPIEVKGGDTVKSKSLDIYIEKYRPKQSIRISTKNFGYNREKGIKSIPLYAIFCLKKN